MGADASEFVMVAEEEAPSGVKELVRAVLLGWLGFLGLNVLSGGRPSTVVLDALCVVAIAAAYFSTLRAPRRWRLAVHGTAAVSAVGLVLASWWSGGVEAIAWWYLAAAPLFVSQLAGRVAGLFWSGIGMVLCVLSILNPFHFPAEFIPAPLDRAFGGVVLIAICTAFGWLARRSVERRIENLVQAAESKGELLAAISHEIRTPLHGILGVAAVLGETSLSSDQRELVTALRTSGKALNRIVDDVLDVARLEVGKVDIHPAPSDLFRVLEDVVDLHAADAGAKGLELVLLMEGGPHFRVLADETRVGQMVSNLISNAIKFTASGSVVVRAHGERTGEQCQLQITVEDTGPGIPADRIDRLFTAYDRLDTALARLHGGTGLGLALARDLAVRMGGTLTAERGRSVGAALTLRLPLPSAPPRERPSLSTGATLLVVEPSSLYASAARSVGRALPELTLVVADSLAQAEAFAKDRRLDAILVCASGAIDPVGAREALGRVVRPGVPIILALSAAQIGMQSAVARLYTGTTLRPLRRSRVLSILEEVALLGASPSMPPTMEPHARSALVIDDDAANRRILERLLANRGWQTVLAESAAAGLRALESRLFDAVLCDLHMPNMDGTELVLRARELGYASYFVAATASVRESDRDRCRDAGFDGFLRKPFEPSELDEVLAAASRRARSTSGSQRGGLAAIRGPLLDEKKWEDGKTLLGDEHQSVFDEHVENARRHLAAIRENAGDEAVVEQAAHTIASGSVMLGLSAFGEAARSLELGARTMDTAGRLEAATRLVAILDESIRQVLARSTSAAPSSSVGTVVVRFVGHLDAATAKRKLDASQQASAQAKAAMLIDCREMTDYDADARRAFEAWYTERPDAWKRVAVLTHNGLWHAVVDAMGVVTQKEMRAFRDEAEARAWLARA